VPSGTTSNNGSSRTVSLQRLRVGGKQQPRLISRPVEQRRQILEDLADNQLGVVQTQRRQPRGVERMVDLARMLQQQNAGAAVEAGDQRAQAVVCGAGSGHWGLDIFFRPD
jgi:hypothetical protein